MKAEVTYSDVAVYLPQEDAWRGQAIDVPDPQMPWAWGEYEMRNVEIPSELIGYHPLWINTEFLRKAVLEEGYLSVGDCKFSSLYVNVKFLDLESLEIILVIAKNGFPICFKNKPEQAGKIKSGNFESHLELLLSLKNVSGSFEEIVASKPLIQGTDLPDFWCRRDKNKHYIFFANPYSQNLRLPVQYDMASSCGPSIIHITINLYGKSIDVTLDFVENQSLLMVVDHKGDYRFEDVTYHN